MVAKCSDDLWQLAFGRPELDPSDLAAAVEELASRGELDYRSRLLVRDSVDALKDYWPTNRVEAWLSRPDAERIRRICEEDFEKVGFPSLRKRLMEKTQPDTIRQYFESLGMTLQKKIHIDIAGAVSLILPGYVHRSTADIDIVGEVPEPIRTQYRLLDDLERRYGLHLGHVQTHYFPKGWSERVHAFGIFSRLEVSLVDVYDVFLSKVFSSRNKDKDDLTVLKPQIDKEVLVDRFENSCGDFLPAVRLKEIATENWRVLFSEALPTTK
jgi:hypothetical protein